MCVCECVHVCVCVHAAEMYVLYSYVRANIYLQAYISITERVYMIICILMYMQGRLKSYRPHPPNKQMLEQW